MTNLAGPDYEPWMRQALLVAAESERSADVPVGALVFDGKGSEIARACNEREFSGDPTAHAEILALRRASERLGMWRLLGCTLVVTLEPCTMCAGAAVLSRVTRVVYGAADPKAGAAGSVWDALTDPRLNHRPDVVGGVCALECSSLLKRFFAARR